MSFVANGHLSSTFDEEAIGLILRVDNYFDERRSRIVQFFGPGPEVNTTSVSWSFALASSESMNRRVLFLTASAINAPFLTFLEQDTSPDAHFGERQFVPDFRDIAESPVSNTSVVVRKLPLDNVLAGNFFRQGGKSVYWQQLLQRFDTIVIDCPAPQISHVGHVAAALADAVIVVVEAELTRAQVARKFVENLQAIRANVIGVVLNNRRYYVPDAIYRRL